MQGTSVWFTPDLQPQACSMLSVLKHPGRLALLCSVGLVLGAGASFAQGTRDTFPPAGWHAPSVVIKERHARRPARHGATERQASTTSSYRGLTINRAPDVGDDTDPDVLVDGNTRYNDIRSFNPAPYVTSGYQFPFGLDGVGGYGDDLGFDAGNSASLYQR